MAFTTWRGGLLGLEAANGLLASGARPGDVVGLRAHNHPETLAAFYGIARAGMGEPFIVTKPEQAAAQAAGEISSNEDIEARRAAREARRRR